MLNEASFPAEIRPDQAHAALRIGFLLRRIEHESAIVWTAPLLDCPDVESTFQELDGELLSLSRRFNDFDALKLSKLRSQMEKWFTVAFHLRLDWILATPLLGGEELRQIVENDPATHGHKKSQKGYLDDLRKILLNVIGDNLRISAWFEIGDHLGHAIFRFVRGELSLPLSARECTQLRSGVRRLPANLQSRVNPFFPNPNRVGYDLAAELHETYQGLCNLVLKLSPMTIPVWDGAAIKYQGESHSIKMQRNSVIIPILAEFERQGWPLLITHTVDVDDVKQALFKFNKSRVIRLSQSGNQIRWCDREG